MPTSSDSLIGGIAPRTITHQGPAAQSSFKPWHKPRKQVVRSCQWTIQAKSLLPHLNLDGRPLRYLSLPGPDMLDIRVFASMCRADSIPLRCLGFDDAPDSAAERTERSISWNEISNLIRESSTILPDNFDVLADKKAKAFTHVRELGPFDVINLDFCKSISCSSQPRTHEALFNLLECQINTRREPWLFFLTTRADAHSVADGPLRHYLDNVDANASSSGNFRTRMSELLASPLPPAGQVSTSWCKNLPRLVFPKVFAIGFGKWLLKILETAHSRWTIHMQDSYWYRTGSSHIPDMLSLSFLVKPVPVILCDPSNLVSPPTSQPVSESDLALDLIDKSHGFIDLDALINADSALLSSMISETSALLKQARYDVNGYSTWARSNLPRI